MLRFISILTLLFCSYLHAYTFVTPLQHTNYCNALKDSSGRSFEKGTNNAGIGWCDSTPRVCVAVHQNSETQYAFCISKYPDPDYCEGDAVWNNATQRCEAESCPSGQELDEFGQCYCTDGERVNQLDGSFTCQNDDQCDESNPNYQGFIVDSSGNGKAYCDNSDDWCKGENQTLGFVNGEYQCMSNNPCENNGTGIWTEGQCKQPSENPDGTNTTGKTTTTTIGKDGTKTETTTEKKENPNTGEKSTETTSKETREGETGDLADIEGKLGNIKDGIGEINEKLGGEVTHNIDSPKSAADVHNNFYNSIQSTPVFSSANAVSNAFNVSATSCPTYSFNIPFLSMGGFDFDYHCSLWPSISSVISALMLLVWSFIGVRIILEA